MPLLFLSALIGMDLSGIDFEMFALSALLFCILTWVIMQEKDKMSPLVFFSMLFYGYVFSGFYFAHYENAQYAKFFQISGNFATEDLTNAMLKVVIGYVSFVVGYKLISGKEVQKINLDILLINYQSQDIRGVLVALFFASFVYWLYVSFVLAGGPGALLENMGIYLLLLGDNPVSTAPYLLAYAATSILFLVHLRVGKQVPYHVALMILLSFLMSISTGRLASSVFYLISFPLMRTLYFGYRLKIRGVFGVALGCGILGCLYFYRYYSNLQYLGMTIDSDIGSLIGEHFFGMTNVGDLQSIVFAAEYAADFGYLFGESFFDLFALWASKLKHSDIYELSIGVRLREHFFSNVDTGAPAPGVISEMIMNFGFFGLTLGMAFLGGVVRVISNMLDSRRNMVNLYVYTHFLLFLALLAKVDSTHLSAFFWAVIPFMVLALFLSLLTKLGLFCRPASGVGGRQ